jgi:hypothetical protein
MANAHFVYYIALLDLPLFPLFFQFALFRYRQNTKHLGMTGAKIKFQKKKFQKIVWILKKLV